MKKFRIIILIVLVIALVVISAFDTRLKVRKYVVESPKIQQDLHFALITDLHSCLYGENQQELLGEIDDRNPDAVLLVGDIFDDVMPNYNSEIFVSEVVKKYPTYYVSGNHEWWSGKMEEIFDYLREKNVKVLRGECDTVEIKGQTINICGIDDPDGANYDAEYEGMETQLSNAMGQISGESFTMLLAHRPEKADLYFQYDVDLVLSGHAHGGQWRIPAIMNGFFAPNQGFFPEYAGGEYDFSGKKLIVSRGLSRENQRIPRVFNRPELVFVTLK